MGSFKSELNKSFHDRTSLMLGQYYRDVRGGGGGGGLEELYVTIHLFVWLPCNGYPPNITVTSLQSIHEISSLTHVAIVASPRRLRDKLQRAHVTHCNLPATCLATQVRKKIAPSNANRRARLYFLQ